MSEQQYEKTVQPSRKERDQPENYQRMRDIQAAELGDPLKQDVIHETEVKPSLQNMPDAPVSTADLVEAPVDEEAVKEEQDKIEEQTVSTEELAKKGKKSK